MYFGLVTNSYQKNKSGGVLRSNLRDINSEYDNATGIISSNSKIIKTLDMFEIKNYSYTSNTYGTECPLGASFSQGSCKDWGNPLGEMYFEALRYLMARPTTSSGTTPGPTSQYSFTGGDSNFSGMPNDSGAWLNPWSSTGVCSSTAACPSCAKPFILSLSDANPSFDSDQLPGSQWASTVSDDAGLNVQTLITNSNINTLELSGVTQAFVGQYGSTSDSLCSAKTADFRYVRGICPGEPTLEGSFYIAGLAHWAHTTGFIPSGLSGESNRKKVTTYMVATQPNVQNLQFTVSGRTVSLIPTFLDYTITSRGQIVDFRIIRTPDIPCVTGTNNDWWDSDSSMSTTYKTYKNDCQFENVENGYTHAYEIAYDDSIAGADYDLDVRYRLYVKIDGNYIYIKTKGVYANAGHEDRAGFLIYGTGSSDAEFMELSCGSGTTDCSARCDGNCSASSVVSRSNNGMAYVERRFAVSGSNAAFLKNPLWYAAKYGGFKDTDSNHTPNTTAKWDSDGDGLPDTYFDATNPLELETKLLNAFLDILSKVSSGTAVSMLTSSEGSGSNLLQAVFYPNRTFIAPVTGTKTEIAWTSELQNLWYYLDPLLGTSSIREESSTSGTPGLNLGDDKKISFLQDTATNTTLVYTYDSSGNVTSQVPFEDFKNSLWRAGLELWKRDLSTAPRNIYTNLSGSRVSFNQPTNSALQAYLQVPSGTAEAMATNIINYVSGVDFNYCANNPATITCTKNSDCGTGGTCVIQRKRTVPIDVNGDGTLQSTETRVWKLGDIISSTPRVQSTIRLNTYHLSPTSGYNDQTYQSFISSNAYTDRGMAYVGANDGMLHAFKLGKLVELNFTVDLAELQGSNLGREEWAFIPKHALPYLQHMSASNYGHLYYVDLPVTLADVSLGSGSETETSTKTSSSWKTVLIGGMNLGGASKESDHSCSATTECVKTPWATTDTNKGIGLSSYFALDVTNVSMTDPTNFSLLWEIAPDGLGFATTGPAIVRVGSASKNGKWYAVFASGPTGPIDTSTHQFKGMFIPTETLKIYIVDIKTGSYQTIDTGITNAFAGSLHNASLDTDRWNPAAEGFYQDDVVYIGYSKCADASITSGSCSSWTGGVLRLVTSEQGYTNTGDWTVSNVIVDIGGPVTTAVTKLQDRKNNKLWLYFGTGRYYYKTSSTVDDANGHRRLFGIQEPCYNTSTTYTNKFNPTCTTYIDGVSSLANQTTYSGTCSGGTVTTCSNTVACDTGYDCNTGLSATQKGWYIDLPCSAGETCTEGTSPTNYFAERVITDPLAAYNGAVFFTTFSPTMDVCGFSGNTYIWAVGYNSGGAAPLNALQGTALIQVSSGAIKEVTLSSAFGPGRKSPAITGMPPTGSGLAISIPPKPLLKFMHIQEK